MPLPTDKVQNARTFRSCAKDPLGTVYHEQAFAVGAGWVASFRIERGVESLVGSLNFGADAHHLQSIPKRPVFHGTITHLHGAKNSRMTWAYDQFGDTPFSALKAGNHRDLEAKEWGTAEVFLDSIDEVRRVLGLEVVVEKPGMTPKPLRFGGITRRLIL